MEYQAPLSQITKDEMLAQRKREYLIAIKPYIEVITQIHAVAVPTITMNDDGSLTMEPNFSREQLALLEQVDNAISALRSQYLTT